MRSLIILEVEHGEDTDGLTAELDEIADHLSGNSLNSVHLNEYTVRVDLPECFKLDSDIAVTHNDHEHNPWVHLDGTACDSDTDPGRLAWDGAAYCDEHDRFVRKL